VQKRPSRSGFVATVAYLDEETAALKFSRTKRFDEFTGDELAHLANRAAMPENLVLKTARETVELFRKYW
jgi:serine/threonine-protein kinase HipA